MRHALELSGADARADGALHRSRDASGRQADLRGRRPGSRSSKSCSATTGRSTACRSRSATTVRVAEKRRSSAASRRSHQRPARSRALHAPALLNPRLLLSCGEPSGDLYAGALTRELRALAPGIDVCGLGGPQFARRRRAADRGLPRARGHRAHRGRSRKLPQLAAASSSGSWRRRAPSGPTRWSSSTFPTSTSGSRRDVKKLGDPGRLLHQPADLGVAARAAEDDPRVADRVLVIFPFEEAIYREAGVPVEFVGHPLVDLATPPTSRATRFCGALGLRPEAPTVAVLPGSRPNEVRRILPDLVAAATRIRARGAARAVRGRARAAPRRRSCSSRRVGSSAFVIVEGRDRCRARVRPTWRSPRQAPRPCRPRCTTRRWSSSTGCRR